VAEIEEPESTPHYKITSAYGLRVYTIAVFPLSPDLLIGPRNGRNQLLQGLQCHIWSNIAVAD